MVRTTLPIIESDRQLRRYFREIQKFPLLDPERELALAIRCRDSGDSAAAHKLITSHLRLVAKIAVRYRSYGVPIDDLISEGSVRLRRPSSGALTPTEDSVWPPMLSGGFARRSWNTSCAAGAW